VAQWISSLRDSRVSPTPWQESVRARRTNGGSGETSNTSYETANPKQSSSKTCRGFSVLDFETSYKDLPVWGSMRSGLVEQRQKPELPTNAHDSSCWPTPTVATYGYNQGGASGRVGKKRYSLHGLAKMWATPTARDWKDGYDPSPRAPTNSLLGRQAPRMWKDGKNTSDKVGLNPLFVEALMGLPAGWTDCVSSVMGSAPHKQD